MNEGINGAEEQETMTPTTAGTEFVPRGGALTGAPPLKNVPVNHVPEQVRLDELEAANARLLQLVGELLIVNQQLREQNTACRQYTTEAK
jgi:hypothetical protein